MKNYQKITFPKTRIATLDVCEVGRKKHHMKALLELDVTDVRQLIKQNRARTKKRLSFNGWLIKTISKTLEDFTGAHAYLKNKKTAVIFNDIDISITVEREFDGELVPLPYVLRKTNEKNFYEISEEIYSVKNQTLGKDEIVLGQQNNRFSTNLYYALPGFLRRLIWKFILTHPTVAQRSMGSVILTSIGMMGKVNGWFIHTSVHPISFGVSSIIKKPGVVRDRIEIREFLNMTVLLDYDVIDGAPMARFIQRLAENVERGLGLDANEK